MIGSNSGETTIPIEDWTTGSLKLYAAVAATGAIIGILVLLANGVL